MASWVFIEYIFVPRVVPLSVMGFPWHDYVAGMEGLLSGNEKIRIIQKEYSSAEDVQDEGFKWFGEIW